MNGTVKFFNTEKGFGFIVDETGKDIFVHHSGICKKDGSPRILTKGKAVTFNVVQGQKGEQAQNVVEA